MSLNYVMRCQEQEPDGELRVTPPFALPQPHLKLVHPHTNRQPPQWLVAAVHSAPEFPAKSGGNGRRAGESNI